MKVGLGLRTVLSTRECSSVGSKRDVVHTSTALGGSMSVYGCQIVDSAPLIDTTVCGRKGNPTVLEVFGMLPEASTKVSVVQLYIGFGLVFKCFLAIKGSFVEGMRLQREGFGKYVSPSGFEYEGEWKEDKQNGKGKTKWPDGDMYEGECRGEGVQIMFVFL